MKSLQLRYGLGRQDENGPVTARSTRQFHNKRRKRRITLINKAHELATRCDAHVYVLVRYGGRYYSYKSLDQASWPPSQADINSSYPIPIQLTCSDMGPTRSENSEQLVAEAERNLRARSIPPAVSISPGSPAENIDGDCFDHLKEKGTHNEPAESDGEDFWAEEAEVPCVFRP